jgi:hypothetical protein
MQEGVGEMASRTDEPEPAMNASPPESVPAMNASPPESVPAILAEEVAAVVDRLVPVTLRHLDEDRLAGETGDMYFSGLTLLLGQYGDEHSQYYGNEEVLATAWRGIEHELAREQPRFAAYDTLFVVWELFDCFRAAEGVLAPSQLDKIRALFRPLGELLLDNPWDFGSDDRTNPALLRSTDLAVCGWALEDDRMRRESRAQAEVILAECCDENSVPSELSISYYAHMMQWVSQACEVEHCPELLRILSGMCCIVPMLVYEPTLELTGPDCRDQWKTVGRHTMDVLVVGLRAAAVLLPDAQSEWLCRALFHRWVRDADPDSSVYTHRSPRYIGVERYEVGWGHVLGGEGFDPGYGAADAPRLVTATAMRTGHLMCALKRWLGPEVAASKPTATGEYCSSKLSLRRYWKGQDMAAVANTIQPVSYMTPEFGLQGIELWTDDQFFWFNMCRFQPTAFSDDGFALSQAPYTAAMRKEFGTPAADRIVHGAAKHGDHLVSLTKIDCSQELAPGIVSWAGLLLVADRQGEVIFGRGGEVGRGRVLEEQTDCDWILYPCGEGRRFGFGIVALDTTGASNRLSNFSGDWCVLGLSQSAEPINGLQAFAVVAIGPWDGTPESYAEWLRAWQAEACSGRCVLVAPEGKRMEVRFPPVS